MGINALLTILFFFVGISVFASDIKFDELIKQSSNEQLQVATDLSEHPEQEEIYLNVQKKSNASAQMDLENNDGLKVVLKKKQKKKKKKKPASVSSPVVVPIKGN